MRKSTTFLSAVTAAALGKFVHVYVDAESRRPTDVPQRIRDAVASLLVKD